MTLPLSQQNRAYHQHGQGIVSRARPYLLARIADPTVTDADLTPAERAARALREEMLDDLGSDPSAAARALLDASVGSLILLQSIDAYLFRLAERGGLVNKRSRKAFAIVHDRMRIADSLRGQLTALGLERRKKAPRDLDAYVAERYGGQAPTAQADEPATPEPSPSVRSKREPVR